MPRSAKKVARSRQMDAFHVLCFRSQPLPSLCLKCELCALAVLGVSTLTLWCALVTPTCLSCSYTPELIASLPGLEVSSSSSSSDSDSDDDGVGDDNEMQLDDELDDDVPIRRPAKRRRTDDGPANPPTESSSGGNSCVVQ